MCAQLGVEEWGLVRTVTDMVCVWCVVMVVVVECSGREHGGAT